VQFWEYLIIALIMVASAVWHAFLLRNMARLSEVMRGTVDDFQKLIQQTPESVVGSLKVSVECPVCHEPIIAEPGIPAEIPHAECRGRASRWN